MALDPDELAELLGGMSKEELEQVIKHAKAVKQFAHHDGEQAPVIAQAGTDPHDYVLAIICDVCRKHGIDLRGVAQAKQLRIYPTFRRHVAIVVKHLKAHTRNKAVECALLRLIYEHMALSNGWGLPMLMARTLQLPLMLDEIFPGYYDGGLLHIAVEQLESRSGRQG